MARKEHKTKTRGAAGMHKKVGEEFLLKNIKKEGVLATDSGLQYQIVEFGSGAVPDSYSTVIIHQRAQLLHGAILEDTYRVNTPDELPLNELIEGLQEGLQLMKVGSRYKFWVPSDLAWGKKGTSSKIPPFAVLSFDIRLIDIK